MPEEEPGLAFSSPRSPCDPTILSDPSSDHIPWATVFPGEKFAQDHTWSLGLAVTSARSPPFSGLHLPHLRYEGEVTTPSLLSEGQENELLEAPCQGKLL